MKNGTATNCIIRGNHAQNHSGGVNGGIVINSEICFNSSARYGGGANSAQLYGCSIHHNTAVNNGGGTDACSLYNCTVTANEAGGNGGGVWLNNNTNYVVRNTVVSATVHRTAVPWIMALLPAIRIQCQSPIPVLPTWFTEWMETSPTIQAWFRLPIYCLLLPVVVSVILHTQVEPISMAKRG